MTKTNPVPVLSDDEVREIAEMFPHAEYQPDAEAMPLCSFCDGSIDDHKANCVVPHVHALCATVRVLRAERDDLLNRSYQTVFFECGCIFKQDGLDDEPRLTKHCDHTALREQLAQETERADSNFASYDRIKTLYSENVNMLKDCKDQLAQVTQERNQLLDAMNVARKEQP